MHDTLIKIICLLSLLHCVFFSAFGQKDSVDVNLLNYSLQDLLKMKVNVASQEAIPLTESPGVISIITENEIVNSGAKDLMSLLRLIPGIDFGSEWDNIIGIGIRGNNATEGKILLLLDGHQLNETNFGSFSFGQHILINNISRIEIIRGPGSVIYGGSAELAVINIITKNGGEINGCNASASYGFSENTTSFYDVQAAAGDKNDKGFEYKILTGYRKGNRSNNIINTLDSCTINYSDSSAIEAANVNLNLSYKSLNTHFFYDYYLSQNTESQGYVLFGGFYFSADYTLKINDKISVKPRFYSKTQKPWIFVDNPDKEFYNTKNTRHIFTIPVIFNSKRNFNLILGSEFYWDVSRKLTDSVYFTSNNETRLYYYNYAIYCESVLKTKFSNFIVGARYDNHNVYGGSFVPRVAITKTFDRFYFKLLYSNAFKAPTISNIDYNKDIKPEFTTVYELETGLQLNKKASLSINIFDISIQNPIIYIPNPVTGADYYKNFPSTGSRGLELNSRFAHSNGFLNFSGAFYQKAYNEVPYYNVENIPYSYGAFPTWKASMFSSISFSKKITLNTTLLVFGNRYTYVHADKNWTAANLVTYRQSYLLNLNILAKDFLIKGLTFNLGVNDLTNQKFQFINAYQGWQNQIPDMGREFFVRIYYEFNNLHKAK